MADGDQKLEIELALRESMSAGLQAIVRELNNTSRKAQEAAQSGSGLSNLSNLFGGMSKTLLGPLGVAAGFVAMGKALNDFATGRVQLEYFARDARLSTAEAGKLSSAIVRMGADWKTAQGYVSNLTGAIKDIAVKQYGSEIYDAIAKMPGGYTFAEKLRKDSNDMSKSIQDILELFRDPNVGPNAKTYIAAKFGVPESIIEDLLEKMSKVKRSFEVTPEMRQYSEDWNDFMDDWEKAQTNVLSRIFRAYGWLRAEREKAFAPGYKGLLTPPEETKEEREKIRGKAEEEAEKLRRTKPFSWRDLFKRGSYEEGEGAGETTEFSAKSMSFSGRLQTMKAFERGGVLGALQQRGYELPPWLQKAYGFLNNPDMVMAMGSLNPLASPGAIPMKALMAEMPVSAATGLLDWRRRSGLSGGGEIKDLIDTEDDSNKLLRDIRDTLDRMETGGAGGGGDNYTGYFGGSSGLGPGIGPKGTPSAVEKYFGYGGPTGKSGANFLGSEQARKLGIVSGPGQNLVTVDTAAGPITVNKEAAGDLTGAINELASLGAPVGKPGSFAMRNIAGSSRISQHAMGGALDVFGQRARGVISQEGMAWLRAHPDEWRRIKQKYNLVGGEEFGDVGHIEWGGPGFGEKHYGDQLSGTVRGSTFDDLKTASGMSPNVPGIALPSRAGLGKPFKITTPDGRSFVALQTDVGPAQWTGRGIDINRPLAERMGYSQKNFPTDAPFKYEPYDAFRGSVDKQMSGGKWEGAANIEVDFKNVPRGVRTSVDQEGFKTLKIKRDRQGEISDRNTADNTWAYE